MHIGGVLVVFSHLVVPAMCATCVVNSIAARFGVGWEIATLTSVASLFITTRVELPIGAEIVGALRVLLVLVAIAGRLFRKMPE